LGLEKGKLKENPDRFFRFEETLTFIDNNVEENVVVYALSDMLLIAEIGVTKFFI
jgi:hypothetical protein